MKNTLIAILVMVSAASAGVAVAAATGLADPPACGRPLREVRRLWMATERDGGPDTCRAREALWLELRQCYAGFGDWLPDIRSVGDCQVEAQDRPAAQAFYRRVLESVPALLCTHDGWNCDRAASVELRLLDCGFGWLAADAETAWKDFAAALLDPSSAVPTRFHLEPVVNTDDSDGVPDLACGAFVPGTQAPAGAPGFVVPAALTRNAAVLANAVTTSSVAAGSRAVSVELNATEIRRALTPLRFLRVQACPFTRPHIGSPGPKYFIELNLATDEDRAVAHCRSPWAWVGRRLP